MFKPTNQQASALERLRNFLDSDDQAFGLFGAAGTGKTSVVGALFKGRPERVCLAAPTHKAASVLYSKSEDLPCATIHRLLGCKKTYDKERGEVEFLPSESGQPIAEYSVVVVDECSMIGDRLYGWIMDAAQRYRVKIIWTGDPYQLPPVNDGDQSPAFDVDDQIELTEIMRHTGQIQRSCDRVREHIQGKRPLAWAEEGGGVKRLEDPDDWFSAFLESPHDSKILAYTNDNVDWCNGYVRTRLYGDDAPRFIESERLVVTSTWEPPGGGILHTGTDLEVLGVLQRDLFGWAIWRLRCKTSGGAIYEVDVLAKHEIGRYRDRLSEHRKRKRWGPFFDLKERFCKVRPGWATTIHKSQGSTYRRTFLLERPLRDLWSGAPRARLLYVAYSRAQEELWLI